MSEAPTARVGLSMRRIYYAVKYLECTWDPMAAFLCKAFKSTLHFKGSYNSLKTAEDDFSLQKIG